MDVREKLAELLTEFYGSDPMYYDVDALALAQHLIANGVTAVVRCKGCKHAYINSFSAASGVALCMLLSKRTEGSQIVMKQDDFCSYGERKDGDD